MGWFHKNDDLDKTESEERDREIEVGYAIALYLLLLGFVAAFICAVYNLFF